MRTLFLLLLFTFLRGEEEDVSKQTFEIDAIVYSQNMFSHFPEMLDIEESEIREQALKFYQSISKEFKEIQASYKKNVEDEIESEDNDKHLLLLTENIDSFVDSIKTLSSDKSQGPTNLKYSEEEVSFLIRISKALNIVFSEDYSDQSEEDIAMKDFLQSNFGSHELESVISNVENYLDYRVDFYEGLRAFISFIIESDDIQEIYHELGIPSNFDIQKDLPGSCELIFIEKPQNIDEDEESGDEESKNSSPVYDLELKYRKFSASSTFDMIDFPLNILGIGEAILDVLSIFKEFSQESLLEGLEIGNDIYPPFQMIYRLIMNSTHEKGE